MELGNGAMPVRKGAGDCACVLCRGCAGAEVVWNLSRVRCARIVDVTNCSRQANLRCQPKLALSVVYGVLAPSTPFEPGAIAVTSHMPTSQD